MVITENGRKRPGSDDLSFISLGPGQEKNGLISSMGSSFQSSHPEDGSIVLGKKALRGNKYVPSSHGGCKRIIYFTHRSQKTSSLTIF